LFSASPRLKTKRWPDGLTRHDNTKMMMSMRLLDSQLAANKLETEETEAKCSML
jgi:hypothetical protein